jgi:regulator of cell morphogenesis and NO signaling
MNDDLASMTVGDIVATDFRTAAVFDEFGIDYCCGGRARFDDACREVAVNPSEVTRALDALPPACAADVDLTAWDANRLIDHILETHHTYVRTALPTIARHLAKLVDVHGLRHPELVPIAGHFDALGAELQQHMMKEEHVLFPFVRELTKAASAGRRAASCFGTVQNPIRMMEREHREAGDEMRAIRELTKGYAAPQDGCTTYEVCMAELARFEQDLHRHIHLENNILFPKAIELEGSR